MQSYLQYRGFKKNLRRQVDRHGFQKVGSATRQKYSKISASLEGPMQGTDVTEAVAQARDCAVEEKEIGNNDQPSFSTAHDRVAWYEHSTHSATLPHGLNAQEQRQEDQLSGSTTRHSSNSSTSPGLNHAASSQSDTDHDLQQTGTRLGHFMTGVSAKSCSAKEKTDTHEHYFVVDFQGPNDPLNPHNWPVTRRMIYTFLVAATGLIVGAALSIDSAAVA